MTLLDGIRVVDLSTGIAGPYATKLLADAGADVVKVETQDGDPLRSWTASGADLGGRDGALFRHLNTSRRSIVGTPGDEHVAALVAGADLVVESGQLTVEAIAGLRQRRGLSVLSITPFGRSGPWAHRPATEFTLQALCGSTVGRGNADREPLHAGGRLGEWITGTYAAVAALAALRLPDGDHVDVSMLEAMSPTLGGFSGLYTVMMGAAEAAREYPGPFRNVEVPCIEPTADGLVGFCTGTGQQFEDFLLMIEQPELRGDERFHTATRRMQHQEEFESLVRSWTSTRPTSEIVDFAAALRIPVAPIGTPENVTGFEHFVERGIFVAHPDGDFVQPRVPYRVAGVEPKPFTAAPALGEHTGTAAWSGRTERAVPDRARPLQGVRVVDLTAFWAGPSATQLLAALGADVIKVESAKRPDGMRFSSARKPGTDGWWEWSPYFQANNTGKRDVTLDLSTEDGRNLLLQLVAGADVLIENFSPRVLDDLGITWDLVHATNPRTVMVRMPGFGLDGPWRDRNGFAQTMEQVSGMAWLTGFEDGPPVIPRGPCDPLAGMTAAFALLATLEERGRDGDGRLVEVTMIEAALSVAAELVLEQEAYGATLQRAGNQGPVAAPQGLYPCRGTEQWLALAVADDHQWSALTAWLGHPSWATDAALATAAGRRPAHDTIDKHLTARLADADLDTVVAELSAAGVPAERVVTPVRVLDNEQLRARGFVETVEHPILGTLALHGLPFRFASHPGPWLAGSAPTLGQHNHEILAGMLGLDEAEIQRLTDAGVVGDRPPR